MNPFNQLDLLEFTETAITLPDTDTMHSVQLQHNPCRSKINAALAILQTIEG